MKLRGNVLLDDIFKCNYAYRAEGPRLNSEAVALGETLREKGRTPYVDSRRRFEPDWCSRLFCLCSRDFRARLMMPVLKSIISFMRQEVQRTQRGLLAGFYAMNAPIPVIGISVRAASRKKQIDNVHALAVKTAALLGREASYRLRWSSHAMIKWVSGVWPAYGLNGRSDHDDGGTRRYSARPPV